MIMTEFDDLVLNIICFDEDGRLFLDQNVLDELNYRGMLREYDSYVIECSCNEEYTVIFEREN